MPLPCGPCPQFACAGLISVCWLGICRVSSMHELYVMVFIRSAFNTIYEPSIKSIIMDRSLPALPRIASVRFAPATMPHSPRWSTGRFL